MKIRFTTDCELTIVTNLNQDSEPDEEIEVFRSGEEVEVDLFGYAERMKNGKLVEDHSLPNFQFGDGSCVFGVNTDWFKEIV